MAGPRSSHTPYGALQVVLQVPAQVLEGVGIEWPGERCLRHLLRNAAIWPRQHLGLAVSAQVHYQPVRQVPTPCRIAGKPAFPITISMLWLTGRHRNGFHSDSGQLGTSECAQMSTIFRLGDLACREKRALVLIFATVGSAGRGEGSAARVRAAAGF